MAGVKEDPLEQGMTYVEKLDYRDQQHRHEMAKESAKAASTLAIEKERRKGRRAGMWMGWGITFLVAAAIAAGTFFIVQGVNRDGEGKREVQIQYVQSERDREDKCLSDGGGWVPATLIANSDQGLCVYPGKTAGE